MSRDFEERMKKEYQKVRNAIIEMRLEQYRYADKLVPIEVDEGVEWKSANEIEKYWTGHTVRADWFMTMEESIEYCDTRFSLYPHFKEFAEMEYNHDNETVLDYGCGPGNDLVWYLYKNHMTQIIGMDVSMTALKHAQYRLALMGATSREVRLVQVSDQSDKLPFQDESIDFINCQGVLMHTTSPGNILREFWRVLKKDGNLKASIMVYNKESIWWHLYAAYYLRFINDSIFSELSDEIKREMTLEERFRRSTDGITCAKAECYTPDEFINMCKSAGFQKVVYRGGYPDQMELDMAKKYIDVAIHDERLEEEHKDFLRDVKFDEDGYPFYRGKLCCIGGVYLLYG